MAERCEPPPGTPDGTVCWLQHPEGDLMPAMWRAPWGMWERFGVDGESAPDGWLAKEGYRYHSPVTPPAVVAALEADVARLKLAASTINEEVCQALGKALGYPWFKDDQRNFPHATEADGVCVGDHVAETLAAEAAAKLATVAALVEALEAFNIKVGDVLGGTADALVLRVPTATIQKMAAALTLYREAAR